MMTQTTILANGKLLDLSRPKVMGILNVTPDSFFDGGAYSMQENAISQVSRMIDEGAEIIDIGGMSSRPGAKLISLDEERKRVLPLLKEVRKRFPQIWISIDTIRADLAEEAAMEGVDMINDISAGSIDSGMVETVGRLGLPYILMHMDGLPESMQVNPKYADVLQSILRFFVEKLRKLKSAGIRDVIVDPGFGFGKSLSDNYTILQNMHIFKILGHPIMAGLSRKSMICKALDVAPKDALNGTTALHMVALQQGAKILRVHDVKEAKQIIDLFLRLENQLMSS
jgi:dihydropteroate synthase